MIIRSKAPLRLGLAGGGSDVSPYSDLYGGNVLNATINLAAYCTIEPLKLPLVRVNAADAGVLCEVPLGTGPLSSGAILVDGVYTMVVCILKCFAEWMDIPLGDYELARLAYEIERKDLLLAGGKQDQYAAAFGGFNFMEFLPSDLVIVNPLRVKDWIVQELEASLLLYFTGRSREGAAIIEKQQQATRRGDVTAVEAMHRIKQSAVDMKLALLQGDMDTFARIIGSAWEDKKKMADTITNPQIQQAFDVALAAGAISGKVSGAGGGGFIMLMVPPQKRVAVREALRTRPGQVVPFQFTQTGAVAWKL